VCGSDDGVETCHDCLDRHYCSPACQELDWGLHRLRCRPFTEACESCGKKEGLNACSGCLHRKYCCKECQAKAWPDHKVICKTYKAIGRTVTDPEEIASRLLEHAAQLGDANLRESQLRVTIEALALCKAFKVKRDLTLPTMYNLSLVLEGMSRYPEAEIIARDMVAESDKVTRIDGMHAMSAERLSTVLVHQKKFEEARSLAHEATERFGKAVVVTDINAAVRLLEAESGALRCLYRHQEALEIAHECMTVRTTYPARFPQRGKVPWSCFHHIAVSQLALGQLAEAEATLKKAQGMLERDGIEYHPDVVHITSTLGDVYRLQGRTREAKAMVKAVKKLVPRVYPKDHPEYKFFMEKE
jgi:tetratricopeptide (TPR) repeat protein